MARADGKNGAGKSELVLGIAGVMPLASGAVTVGESFVNGAGIQAIRAAGMKPGVALNPGTPADAVDPVLDDVDLILVMSVNPGFGGQSFIESQLRKIEILRRKIDASGRDIILEVDGGLNPETAPRAIAAGVTAFVAGSAVFRGGPDAYAKNISDLRVGATI